MQLTALRLGGGLTYGSADPAKAAQRWLLRHRVQRSLVTGQRRTRIEQPWTLIMLCYRSSGQVSIDRCSMQLAAMRPPKMSRTKIGQPLEPDARGVPPTLGVGSI